MSATDAETMDVLAEWASKEDANICDERGDCYIGLRYSTRHCGSPECRAAIIKAASAEAARRKDVSNK